MHANSCTRLAVARGYGRTVLLGCCVRVSHSILCMEQNKGGILYIRNQIESPRGLDWKSLDRYVW